MSHTISARKPEGFKVEVFDWNGGVAHSGWYQGRALAQAVAHHWERLTTIGLVDSSPVQSLDDFILSDDELFRELKA